MYIEIMKCRLFNILAQKEYFTPSILSTFHLISQYAVVLISERFLIFSKQNNQLFENQPGAVEGLYY